MKMLKNILTLKIADVDIDFEVHYDFTCKVYQVNTFLFDLAESGQRLILGEYLEEKKQKIKDYENLIPLILPIGVLHQKIFFTTEFASFYKRINQEHIDNNIQMEKLHEFAEAESLEYFLFASKFQPSLCVVPFKLWMETMNLIKGISKPFVMENFSGIAFLTPEYAFEIIPRIIPFLKDSRAKNQLYKTLKFIKSDACKEYLFNELNNCSLNTLADIVYSLSHQNIDSPHVQNKLVAIYNDNEEINDYAKEAIMSVFRCFPNNKTIAIGLDIISQNNHSSKVAASVLLSIGYPVKELADIMLKKLYSLDPKQSEFAFTVLDSSPKFIEFLPSNSKLLKIYVETSKDDLKFEIIHSMPSLVKKNQININPNEIEAYLSTNNSNVLQAIMRLASRLLSMPDANPNPFITAYTKSRYVHSINHHQKEVRKCSVVLVAQIGKYEKNESCIDFFLDRIDLTSDRYKNVICMDAITDLLQAFPYNKRIDKIFLNAIKSSDEYISAALKGLQYTNDIEKMKSTLAFLRNHPNRTHSIAWENFDRKNQKFYN